MHPFGPKIFFESLPSWPDDADPDPPMDNTCIGDILRDTGMLLALKDGPSTESDAYEQIGREVARLPRQLAWLPPEAWPESVKSLPDEIRTGIAELIEDGTFPRLDDLRSHVPPGLIELANLPEFKPARVRLLRDKLGVESVEDLEAACRSGRIAELPQFDEGSQRQMLDGITFWRSNADRHHLQVAWVTANPILERMRTLECVIRCSVTGALRRWNETVPGISFLVSSTDTEAVLDFYTSQAEVDQVISREEAVASVIFKVGLRSTIRVVTDRAFPFSLVKYTGNGAHFEKLSQRAREQGYLLNEWGLSRSENDTHSIDSRRCHGEEEIYYALGLECIPPELREDLGEFEAAEKHEIPPLVEWTALRGSLHNHSDWSDGRQTLKELASHAYDLGFSYWAVTDHSKSCFVGKGIDHRQLIAQINEVELVNQLYQDAERPFRLLSGTEVDIRAGGRLDLANDILAQLDVVVASIHQSLAGSEAEMTRRLIAAAENRYVQILGHLSGRLLLQRDAYKVDQRAVIDACAETGTWIELNAHAWRADMDWRMWRYARERGVKCVINTNSHRAEHAQNLRFGAHLARKGWLTKHDVVNTLSLKRLRSALLQKRLA